MATSFPNLCLRARNSPRLWSIQPCRGQSPSLIRCFTTTRCHNRKNEADIENQPSKPRHFERKEKRTLLRPSQIDAPRAVSSRKLLESFQVEEDEIDKIINEKDGDEYKQFLDQYGAAISPERPEDYDRFLAKQGLATPQRDVDAADEIQMAARIRYQEKKIQATARYLAAQNTDKIRIKRERAGFVTDGDYQPGEMEFADEPYEADDLTVLGHGYLEQHREIREYYRLAAWELPLLSKYAKAFELPVSETPLRFRYTSYMGEKHPAEAKVVVEFCTADLPLTPKQRLKLVKLLGPRYNPQKDTVKMACESFPEPAQNKRYLSDLIDTLLEEARLESADQHGKDNFDDVPADFRHVKWDNPPKFPDAWKLTPTRREKLFQGWTAEVGRSQRALLQGTNVDGAKTIAHFLGAQPAVEAPQTVKVR